MNSINRSSYLDLIKTHKEEDGVEKTPNTTIEAHQIIKDLKKALKMKGGLSGLLKTVEKTYYLLPDVSKM